VIVQPPVTNISGTIKAVPAQLLAELALGQRLDVEVNKPVAVGDIIAVSIAGKVIELQSPIAIPAGQKLQLELVMERGQPVLKFVTPTENQKINAPVISSPLSIQNLNSFSVETLKQGQQIAVEVVKLLANKRLLVQAIITNVSKDNIPAATSNATRVNSPIVTMPQFDIDVSKLVQRPQVGEQLQMTILSVKPLNIQLTPFQAVSREQYILDAIRQLIPQQLAPSRPEMISQLNQHPQLPETIRQTLQQLMQHSTDKSQLTEAGRFKEAVMASGALMERKLITTPNSHTQDFKANIGKLLAAVETSIGEMKRNSTTAELNKLPAQVQSALLISGKTPAQLLNVLLSSYRVPLLSSSSPFTFQSAITSPNHALSLAKLITKPFTTVAQETISSQQQARINLTELVQLFKEVEGVHSKLKFNQLMMLKDADANNTLSSWLFDVPIKDKHNLDIVQMQIDRQKQSKRDDDENNVWNVKLRLDTQNLGPVQANVTLHKQDVKLVFRAERPESAQLFIENLTLLEQAINKLDLNLSHSSCSCGKVDNRIIIESNDDSESSSELLDVSV
jgi:hypothetical protein